MCLILLLTGSPAGTQLRVLLDGLIVAAAIFGAAWVTWLETVCAAQPHDLMSVAMSLVYPVVDIALITVAASDTAFAYLTATDGFGDHHVIAIGWAWGFALGSAALSAVRDSSADTGPQATTVSRWLPDVPVLLSAVPRTPVLIAGLAGVRGRGGDRRGGGDPAVRDPRGESPVACRGRRGDAHPGRRLRDAR